MIEQIEHWITLLCGALTAMLVWCWRIARRDQEREQRITRLEQWRVAHMAEYRDLDKKIDALMIRNTAQDVTLSHIKEAVDNINTALGTARLGGSRWYDPQRREHDYPEEQP